MSSEQTLAITRAIFYHARSFRTADPRKKLRIMVGLGDFDPRVYFAAERTLLAWLRTGLTVMAFGFVIARFGLLLQVVAVQAPNVPLHVRSGVSVLFGVALVGIGTAMIFAATLQYRRVIATLPAHDRPRPHSGGTLILISSFLVALVGLALTAYLLLTSG